MRASASRSARSVAALLRTPRTRGRTQWRPSASSGSTRSPGNAPYRLPKADLMVSFAGEASRYGPVFAGTYHLAAELWIHPPPEVVVLGGRDHPRAGALRRAAVETFAPGKTVLVVDKADAYVPALLVPMLATKDASAGPVALVCQGNVCSPPTSDAARVMTLLETAGRVSAASRVQP